MHPGALVQRLQRVPGMAEVADFDRFDPRNDLHLDQAARLLLERFRAESDADAFTLLFELTHERLHQIATQITRRLSPAADPDDLASGFMARLFAEPRRPSQTPVRRFLALAHTAMRNSVFDQLREQKRAALGGPRYHHGLRQPDDPALAAQHQEEDAVLQRYGRRLLAITDDCFHRLEPRDKTVLVAREILGLSYERVAGLLDLESTQVGMIIRRARQHLADRVVDNLPETALDDSAMQQAARIVRRCLESRQRVKNVRSLVQRMLDAAVVAGHQRLAELVYEMAKSCLLAVPEFEQRMLVHKAPRRRDLVAGDMRDLNARLSSVDDNSELREVVSLARHALTRQAALDDAITCLDALQRLEGKSGRQQVALALHHVHAERLEEAESILRNLLEVDLPERTRQNVFRNLTLTLLRQERWNDALEIAQIAGVEWPEDPVRLMNVCFATARLGDEAGFERHARQLVRLDATDPRPRVATWIDQELPALATALGMSAGTIDTMIASARADAASRKARP